MEKIPDLRIRRSAHEYLMQMKNARKPDEYYGRIFGTINPQPTVEKAYIWPKRLTRAGPVHVEVDGLDEAAAPEYAAARGDLYVLGCVHSHPDMSAFLSGTDTTNIECLLDQMLSARIRPPIPIYGNLSEQVWIKYPYLEYDKEKIIIRDKQSSRAVFIRACPRLKNKIIELKDLLEADAIDVGIQLASPTDFVLYSLVVGESKMYAEAVRKRLFCDVHKGKESYPATEVGLKIIEDEQ